jgi:predicted nucleotidyltransferase
VRVSDAVHAALRDALASHADVRAAYLFGSQVKGNARRDSDIDVGVLYRSPQPVGTTARLEAALTQASSEKVDLVDVGRATAFLALEIVRGERIFTRDPTDTDRFELYVLRRAGDLLPFERQRQALLLDSSR